MEYGLSGCPGRGSGGAARPDRKPVAILSASGGAENKMADPAAGPAESCQNGGRAEVGAQAPASFEIPELDLTACRALWCAVVAENWNLAVMPAPSEGAAVVGAARSWFGSRDYHEVCDLAGVNADDVLMAYRAARLPGAEFRLGITGAASHHGRHRRAGAA